MQLSTPIIQERRTFFFHDPEGSGRAKINFVFKNDSGLKNDGEWEFDGCDFDCKHQTYTLEEWEFLALLYAKIKELGKSLNK